MSRSYKFSLGALKTIGRLSVVRLSIALLFCGGLTRLAKAVDDGNGISLLGGDNTQDGPATVVLSRPEAERALASGVWVTGQSFMAGTNDTVDSITFHFTGGAVANAGSLDQNGNPTQDGDYQAISIGPSQTIRLATPIQVPQDAGQRAALQQDLLNRYYNLKDIVEWENQQCETDSQWYASTNDAFYANDYWAHKARLDNFQSQLFETQVALALVSY